MDGHWEKEKGTANPHLGWAAAKDWKERTQIAVSSNPTMPSVAVCRTTDVDW